MSEIENIWIEAWNKLYDILNENPQIKFTFDEINEVSMDECQAYIQNTVYSGFMINFNYTYLKGKKAYKVSKGDMISK